MLADKLLQPLYGAKEFFISEQLGHKWLQSHLNIVKAQRLGCPEKEPTRDVLHRIPPLHICRALASEHLILLFVLFRRRRPSRVNSNYEALYSKCCFLTTSALKNSAHCFPSQVCLSNGWERYTRSVNQICAPIHDIKWYFEILNATCSENMVMHFFLL